MKKLKIAQVAPLAERVPPKKYGGTEIVIYNLVESLITRGHQVTLFARSDSKTSAKLSPLYRPDPRAKKRQSARGYLVPNFWQTLELGRVFENANDFDIIHLHIGTTFFPYARLVKTPCVLTLHGRLNTAEAKFVHSAYPEIPLVSISNNQRRPLPKLNYAATVYNGIDLQKFKLGAGRGGYLAFLGRMSPEKGPVQAIQAAKKSGRKLVMAAKLDLVDRAYYQKKVEPLIDGRQIVFLGEINQKQKIEMLKNASGLLALIQWEEPFGLFMTEAMACGTPVIATARGSVPEIVKNGETGFVVKNLSQALRAINNLSKISRLACRQRVENYFSAQTMVDNYEAVYYKLICSKK
ncbi:glycosyltransferase family 4 protein [Candidatus Parcubacteria bacterium]|jgi:glycosyltransferase involved in cell wall biosynthesis|nr:MAG: glycosyltransferase family 4 protein [Candidatus Parcubacteria bacterium]